MNEINYLKNTVAEINFFNITINPKSRIHSVLYNDGTGFNWELSVYRSVEYYTTFYLTANNQYPCCISELLKQTEYKSLYNLLNSSNSTKSFNVKSQDPKAQELTEWLLSKNNNSIPENIWTTLYKFFPNINIIAENEKTAFRFFTLLIKALNEASIQRMAFPLSDLEGFISFASREVLRNWSNAINIDKIKYINDETVQLLISSPFSIVSLNGLLELQPNHALQLSAKKEKLFLNSLTSLDINTAKALTTNKLDYLSLRGLKNISKEIEEVFDNSKTFISLKKDVDETNETHASYDEILIKTSLVSNKKEFSNLKKLLSTPDKEVIDSGLILLSSFADPYLFDKLIEKLDIKEVNGFQKLNPEEVFKGPKKDLPFHNYAVTGILYYARPDSILAENIKRKIKTLAIDIFDLSYMHCFYELEDLKIEDSQKKLKTLDELDEQLPIKKLDITDCPEMTDIKHLSVFPLQAFDFTGCKKITSFSALQGKTDLNCTKKIKLWNFQSLTSLDGIEFYQSLEWLDIFGCEKITDISALEKLPALQRVESITEYQSYQRIELPNCDLHPSLLRLKNTSIDLCIKNWIETKNMGSEKTQTIMISCKRMTNMEWLRGFPNLKKLSISCKELLDIKGLRFVPNLVNLDIKDAEIVDLQGLETLTNLEELQILSCSKVKRIDQVENLGKLIDIRLQDNDSLESVEGMIKNKNIQLSREWISFYSLPSLKKMGDLSGFIKLKRFDFSGSFNQELVHDFVTAKLPIEFDITQKKVVINESIPIKFPIKLTHCTEFNLKGSGLTELYLENYRSKSLSGLESMSLLKKMTISESDELETLNGLNNLPALQDFKLNKLKLLADIDSLKEMSSLHSLSMIKLPNIKKCSSIASLSTLETMEVVDCSNLEVKPRPLGKINQEQIMKYQLKLAEYYKLNTDDLEVKIEKLKTDPAKKDAKKNATKIKKLLKERDVAMIDTAISLLSGINDEELINELLFGISYENTTFKTNRIFSGTGPAQPFLNYALTGVLSCAATIEAWRPLITSVSFLEISIVGSKYLNSFVNLETLKVRETTDSTTHFVLNNLKSLFLEHYRDVTLDLGIFSGCPNLEILELTSTINQLNGFVGLKNLVNLKMIKLRIKDSDATHFMDFEKLVKLESLIIDSVYSSQSKKVLSLHGLHNCAEMKELCLDSFLIQDTSALSKLSKLQMLEIENGDFETLELAPVVKDLIKLNVYGCKKLNKISDSLFNEELKEFKIDNTGFTSFPKLKGVKKIAALICNSCMHLTDLKGLNGLEHLNTGYHKSEFLEFNNCDNLNDINDVFSLNNTKLNLDFKFLPKNIKPNPITHLFLGSIESLEGIEQFPELIFLSFRKKYSGSAPIKDLSNLDKLKNLKYLQLGGCQNIETLKGLNQIEHLKMLDLTRLKNLKDIKALNNMKIDILYIAGGLLKKVDFPDHLQDNIDWQTIPR